MGNTGVDENTKERTEHGQLAFEKIDLLMYIGKVLFTG